MCLNLRRSTRQRLHPRHQPPNKNVGHLLDRVHAGYGYRGVMLREGFYQDPGFCLGAFAADHLPWCMDRDLWVYVHRDDADQGYDLCGRLSYVAFGCVLLSVFDGRVWFLCARPHVFLCSHPNAVL